MDLLRIGVASVVGISLSLSVGCANQQSLFDSDKSPSYGQQPDKPKTPGQPLPSVELNDGDVLVKITAKGDVVPVTEQGKAYESCGKEGGKKTVCRIYEGDITVTDIDDISITRLRYTGSGECEILSFIIRGTRERRLMFNPNDPDCIEHHRR